MASFERPKGALIKYAMPMPSLLKQVAAHPWSLLISKKDGDEPLCPFTKKLKGGGMAPLAPRLDMGLYAAVESQHSFSGDVL